MYLRKSRVDIEAEAHGEGETLARHEKLLLEVARRDRLNVTQIYREVVSGETIAARPVMQHLLQEVEQGRWAGVLVVEVERLARGDTIDQGIMAQTFKYSGTKIVTPLKVYDPNNEYDEEYFEFGLFMSRREYKTINRRLQRGRLAAAKEGKWVSGVAPYGYEKIRVPNDKGWTLRPVEAEADIVRFIFRLYTSGEEGEDGEVKKLGTYSLAVRLDRMGVTPSGRCALLEQHHGSVHPRKSCLHRENSLERPQDEKAHHRQYHPRRAVHCPRRGAGLRRWPAPRHRGRGRFPRGSRPAFSKRPSACAGCERRHQSSGRYPRLRQMRPPHRPPAQSCLRRDAHVPPTAPAITSAPSTPSSRSVCCRPSLSGWTTTGSNGLTGLPPRSRPSWS